MRTVALALVTAFAVAAVSTASIAQTTPRKARTVQPVSAPGTVVVHRDEFGRTRTKIIVQKRSYLDGGTEVMPGDNIDPYRNSFLTHRANNGIGTNVITNPPGPVPDPFFLPGKNNPWPGFMY
jgi:hypothetical protein